MISERQVYTVIGFLSELGGLSELIKGIIQFIFLTFYTPNLYLASLIKSMGPVTQKD